MKVKQLIEELEKHDPEMIVVRRGYEGGLEEVSATNKTKIKLNVFDEWYYGSHDSVSMDSDSFDCEAVFID
jgi:hypothetical protein